MFYTLSSKIKKLFHDATMTQVNDTMMCEREKQATPKVSFVFPGTSTSRQCVKHAVEPERAGLRVEQNTGCVCEMQHNMIKSVLQIFVVYYNHEKGRREVKRMYSVLIVEDDEAIANLLYAELKDAGYDCTCAYDGKCAADILEENVNFDLALLDIMLPQINGYELLEYIKPMGIPVIFLTAKGSVEERIKGLKMGADDYIGKPFQMGEVIARMEAVLRRCGKSMSQILFADVVVDLESRKVLQNDEEIELTVKEFDLLVELIQNKNIVQSRDQLYEKVWKEPFFGDTRTLDTHIQRLRKKLGWEKYIRTVFRVGYRLEG